MKMASEADAKGDYYAERAAQFLGSAADDLENRAAFHRGQASGFRQSAYFAAILEGTNAND